ncbi:f-box/kelch-repeat protein [Quercus suber]|uniref:F-box/kelch-repeat protein n=1 Tax=Quercus suber TaxID=58331 RepID=A0AAW0J785_QUESU
MRCLVRVDIIGSSNGLVCLHVDYPFNIILWNPATKETKVVPKSRISYPQSKASLLDLRFGFDIKTNDYKVVMILNADDYSNPELTFLERKFFNIAESESCIHFWSLLEFEVRDSWTKLFTTGPLMRIDKPFGFLKNNSMLLKNNEGQFLLYNLSTQEMTDLRIGGVSKWLQVINYKEILISFKGENDLEYQDSS